MKPQPIPLLNTGILLGVLLCIEARADLLVKVEDVKSVGSKTILKLSLKNTFKEKVEGARAQAFLFDDNGKVVGQAIQWVIGGTRDRPSLAPDGTTTFNFVIPGEKPHSKRKLTFTRLILEGGKTGDPKQIRVSE